jgi:O-antigen/teichoic acid export membrane protein
LSKIFAFLSYRVDVILIGIFLSPVYVAYYDIAFKIYEALKFGIFVIASALVPVSSELGAMTDRRRLELLFNKVSKYTLVFVFPQLVFAIFYAEGIINMWVGKGVEVSVLLTQLFAVSLFFFALTSSGAEMMVGLNKVKELAFCGGIAALINFTISIILVKTIGVAGPVIGTIVGTIILSAGRLYLMLPLFNMSIFNFLKGIILKPVISTILLALIFFAVVTRNLYVGIAVLILHLLTLTFFMIDKTDRKEFIKVFY